MEKRKESKIYADNFWEYCKKSDPEFFFDDKTLLMDLANKLQLVKEKKIRKLAVSMYPRAGKSYTISLFCSWLLGNNPDGCVMRNAYGDHLANKFSLIRFSIDRSM